MQILDTTLRDGSYTVNFGFDEKDTYQIAAALDACGMDFIEVGHGNGLNANAQTGFASAVCHDEIYMRAAAQGVRHGKWGMFFIPGVGTIEDIRLAADYGMGFIRIGTEPGKLRSGFPYLAEAKRHGMLAFCNIMKSYVATPVAFGNLAAAAEQNGADYIVIVDSAGGMLPSDVRAYCEAVKAQSHIPFGIHAHNNMGLAVANTLEALSCGASVLDGSLRGVGRSAGNASVEMLLFALQRMHIETDIDVYGLLETAEKHIDPILYKGLRDSSLSIVSGYAEFHSSFLDKVKHYAELYDVDPKRLITGLTQVNKTGAPDALLDSLARELALHQPQRIRRSAVMQSDDGSDVTMTRLADRMCARAKKRMLSTVLVIEKNSRKDASDYLSGVTNENDQYIVANASAATHAGFNSLLNSALDRLDWVLVDIDAWHAFSAPTTERPGNVHLYQNDGVWAASVRQFIFRLSTEAQGRCVLCIGETKAAKLLADMLLQCGYRVDRTLQAGVEYAFVVCFAPWNLASLPATCINATIIDAAIGSLSDPLLHDCLVRDVRLVRSDMRLALLGEVDAVIGTDAQFSYGYGTSTYEGIRCVAGGCIGRRGDIVVDRITEPSEIYGIADGSGFLLSPPCYNDNDKKNLLLLREKLDIG